MRLLRLRGGLFCPQITQGRRAPAVFNISLALFTIVAYYNGATGLKFMTSKRLKEEKIGKCVWGMG